MSAEDMRFVRGRNNSISALLYILNRLAAVAYAVSTGNEVLPAVTTLDTCTTINYAIGIAYALSLAVTALVSVIRVYAVSQRNWCLVSVASFLGLVPISTNLYATITPKVTVNPQLGCVAVVASRCNSHFRLYNHSGYPRCCCDMVLYEALWTLTSRAGTQYMDLQTEPEDSYVP